MSFKITVTGSHLDGFAAAELSWASPNTEVQIGRVFERPDGWKIELFADEAPLDVPLDEFVGHLQKAKEALLPYINRIGANPPSGCPVVVADDEGRWHGNGYENRMVRS
jgi:hypothetical protein